MKTLFAATLIALSAMPAHAVEWRNVVENNETGTLIQVDIDSIKTIRGGYEYVRSVIKPSSNIYYLVKTQALCVQGKSRDIEVLKFTESGELYDRKKYPRAPFEPVKVGTNGAAEWEFICQ